MPTATEAGRKTGASATPRKTKATTARKGSTTKKTASREMTDEHKAAIQEGREQARAIGRYLEALDQHKPKRGRKVTVESREKRLAEIEASLDKATALERVNLIAERDRIREFLETAGENVEVDLPALEADFVKHALSYSERKDIPRAAWRTFGVPAEVLDKAGIKRSSV